jgi:hypothetical protein
LLSNSPNVLLITQFLILQNGQTRFHQCGIKSSVVKNRDGNCPETALSMTC